MVQRINQRLPTLRVGNEVIFNVGIARHHPDIPQHLVQHPRRTAGAALVAQVEQRLPGFLAEEAQDDLTVGERRVVIGNFPKTGIHGGCAFGVSNAR